MYKASYNDFEIEIIREQDYTVNSADNRFQYDIVHCDPEDDMYAPTSIYGIKIYKDGLYKTAIVMANGGSTGIGVDMAIVDGQSLVLTCCNKVFNLQLPNLQLNWLIIADMATCFSIYQYEDNYIVHGEVEITRLDRFGKIIWQVGVRDIFVNIDHTGSTFQMHDEYIELMDWQGFRYKLFYNGTIVDDGMAPLAPRHE
jgi:hypothetical protein